MTQQNVWLLISDVTVKQRWKAWCKMQACREEKASTYGARRSMYRSNPWLQLRKQNTVCDENKTFWVLGAYTLRKEAAQSRTTTPQVLHLQVRKKSLLVLQIIGCPSITARPHSQSSFWEQKKQARTVQGAWRVVPASLLGQFQIHAYTAMSGV